MTNPAFDKHKFAGSLPAVIILHSDPPQLSCGAASPGFDLRAALPDNRVILQQIWYSTNKRVHGLLHYDGPNPNQLVFFGYECQSCHEVFLVADWVENEVDLAVALRHDGCTGGIE